MFRRWASWWGTDRIFGFLVIGYTRISAQSYIYSRREKLHHPPIPGSITSRSRVTMQKV